jgi:hypothetical protein
MIRTRQPQGAVRVNFGNSIARGLRFAFTPSSRANAVTNALPTTATAVASPRASGIALIGDNNVGYWKWPATPTYFGNNEFSLFVLAGINTPNYAKTTLWSHGNAYVDGCAPYLYMGGSDLNLGVDNLTGFADRVILSSADQTRPHTIGMSIRGGNVTNGSLTSVDNVFQSAFTVSGSLTTGATQLTSVLRVEVGGTGAATNNPTGSELYLALAWDRAISQAEMAALHANPWQLFAPPLQPLYTGMDSGSWTPLEVSA